MRPTDARCLRPATAPPTHSCRQQLLSALRTPNPRCKCCFIHRVARRTLFCGHMRRTKHRRHSSGCRRALRCWLPVRSPAFLRTVVSEPAAAVLLVHNDPAVTDPHALAHRIGSVAHQKRWALASHQAYKLQHRRDDAVLPTAGRDACSLRHLRYASRLCPRAVVFIH